MQELEKVIQLYRDGVISEKEALNRTIEAIWQNPQYFKINRLQEDNLSDFIIYLFPRIERSLSIFDPELSSYRTFISGIVTSCLRTWYKNHYKKKAQRMAIDEYSIEEYMLEAAEAEESYNPEHNLEDKIQLDDIPEEAKKFLFSMHRKIPPVTKIMVLMLKSQHYLTPSLIGKISKATGVKEEKLLDMVLIIKQKVFRKEKDLSHNKEMQNMSYILKKRSELLLNSINSESHIYENIKLSNKHQDEHWKLSSRTLRSSGGVAPKNIDIAHMLGLTPAQIRRLQKTINEGDSQTDEERLSSDYEDICSNR